MYALGKKKVTKEETCREYLPFDAGQSTTLGETHEHVLQQLTDFVEKCCLFAAD